MYIILQYKCGFGKPVKKILFQNYWEFRIYSQELAHIARRKKQQQNIEDYGHICWAVLTFTEKLSELW